MSRLLVFAALKILTIGFRTLLGPQTQLQSAHLDEGVLAHQPVPGNADRHQADVAADHLDAP